MILSYPHPKHRAGVSRLLFISLLFSFVHFCQPLHAQAGLPFGACGIEYVYDAAGNMVDRHYVCNNSGNLLVEQPSVNTAKNIATTNAVAEVQPGKTQKAEAVIQAVNVLHPNPTTGQFHIRMSKALQNARVEIVDIRGRAVFQKVVTGNIVQLDLSDKAAGLYFVNISDDGNMLTFRVMKK